MSDKMSDEQELRACPFCGGGAEVEVIQGFNLAIHDNSTGACDCPIEGTRGLGVEIWNTRPIEDALREEIERLDSGRKEANKQINKHFDTIDSLRAELSAMTTNFEATAKAGDDAREELAEAKRGNLRQRVEDILLGFIQFTAISLTFTYCEGLSGFHERLSSEIECASLEEFDSWMIDNECGLTQQSFVDWIMEGVES